MATLEAAICPDCGEMIQVPNPWVGLEVECPECGQVLRVIEAHPLRLYYTFDLDQEPLPNE